MTDARNHPVGRVLIAEDEAGLRSFLAEVLEGEGHQVTLTASGLEAQAALQTQAFDVLLTDLKMPGLDGIGVLKVAKTEQPNVAVIVLTAHGSVDSAVDAMRLGAFDYLQKPLRSPGQLRTLVQRALEGRGVEAADAPTETGAASRTGELVWQDPAMAPVASALARVAPTQATVLLIGESGTGKEVAARSVHQLSRRRAGPFVAVNCAVLSDNLLESELFGHEKGAFTGAVATRQGKIELAAGGTFFLDELGELKLDLQAKLLRVLEGRTFERLGGTRTYAADVRIVAATHRDLHGMIQAGTFREDLYHRLAVFPIRLPPLRERPGDIPVLAEALLGRIGAELGRPALRLDAGALALLKVATFSGNVRELRNVLERAVILATEDVIEAKHIWLDPTAAHGTEGLGRHTNSRAPAAHAALDRVAGAGETLEALERRAIERALAAQGGNRKRAAEMLGIGLRTLYEKIKRYEL